MSCPRAAARGFVNREDERHGVARFRAGDHRRTSVAQGVYEIGDETAVAFVRE